MELLVAVVLLAVGALGAVTMQRTAVKANQATYANEVATSLARQVLEAARNLEYDDARLAATAGWETVPASLTINDPSQAPSFYVREWQVSASGSDPANVNYKNIDVRVRWNQAGMLRDVVLSTIKSGD